MSSSLIVVKTGGALLTDGAALRRVSEAVARRRLRGERLLVVVSALHGVTDELERAATLALDARSGLELVRDVMERLRRQHMAVAAGLPQNDAVRLRLQPELDAIERLLTGIRLTGELTPRTRDLVMCHGERLAAPLVAAGILAAGADARAVTSEEAGLVATGSFRVGACDIAASTPRLASLDHELFDRVLVLTGYYGVNADGDVVLFGRGGSDYTAGAVAAGLRAGGLELWKDVPGFMSADPRDVADARLVPELSFDEACELGLYGARILHPRCLQPLRGLPIDVSVRPVLDVDVVGTRLVEKRAPGGTPGVVALAARRGVAVVRVGGAAMVNEPGVAGRILSAMGGARINVDAVAASMTSLSFTISAADVPAARHALRHLQEQAAAGVEDVAVLESAALLGVVGDRVAADSTLAGRLLSRLGQLGIDVHLVCHGPLDVGLSCALPEGDLRRALLALHEEFFPGGHVRRVHVQRDRPATRAAPREERVMPGARRPVAVLGATGVAGRQALAALARHPWFEVAAVGASSDSAGKRLGDVLADRAGKERRAADLIAAPRTEAQNLAEARGLPDALLDLRLQDCATLDASAVVAVFSALPSAPARALEARCAATTPVFSTASAYRMEPDTPLLLAGVNPDHAELLRAQQRARGWRGFVAPGPNCTVVGLAVSLAPLQRLFGVTSVTLTSMQAVSGAGARAPEVAAAVAGNLLPWIEQEEEKVESEAHKILGAVGASSVLPADFLVSATCTRVPVEDGHTLSVSVALREPASPGDAAAALLAEDPWRGRPLPSRPARWIDVRREPDRPQPLLDRDTGGGLTTVVGRLRRDAVHGGVKYLVLSHNAVMGAAGGAVLLAEDLADRGFF